MNEKKGGQVIVEGDREWRKTGGRQEISVEIWDRQIAERWVRDEEATG